MQSTPEEEEAESEEEMKSPLEAYELEDLLRYKEGIQRNIEAIEQGLNKEKATLIAIEDELRVRERLEA